MVLVIVSYHVTTAYAPWANGVIERVNREILKLWRVLMAEVSLAEDQWATFRPLVQAVLNRTAGAEFDGLTPSELHLARRVDTPLDTVIFHNLTEAKQEAIEALPRSAQVLLLTRRWLQQCNRVGCAPRKFGNDGGFKTVKNGRERLAVWIEYEGRALKEKCPNFSLGSSSWWRRQ